MTDEGIDELISALGGWADDLSNRVVVVLQAYFDDSGTHRDSPVSVMSGYVASKAGWKKFEKESKQLFKREGIDYFRAKLFEHGQKQFKGWSSARKLRFATEWYDLAKDTIACGVTVGVEVDDFRKARAENKKFPAISDQAYCIQMALGNLWADDCLRQDIVDHGLSIVIEKSGSVDLGIHQNFYTVVQANELEEHIRSIAFLKKQDARALQLADYLAYYSLKFAKTAVHGSEDGVTPFLDLSMRNIRTFRELGYNFQPNPEYERLLRAQEGKPS
jgi:uncharacterized protein DUF3800